ncbi:unnamed protein product [Spirodela intermedia]|uniref:Uncharacterized protein n=1 Tax=Spirodela intermedia TaxID=51605 RepID=A0A7I8IYF0_SPIIN|nr:unnamed protein product [Spirodela intermedia]CAA6662994.1 unnamed protein product [Spirodela intermedia]
MDRNFGSHSGMQKPPSNPQSNPFGNAFYGDQIPGSSSEFMQSNISSYFSDPQYYFQVNGQYVRNKLKIILCPFLYRNQRANGGADLLQAPISDVNAPDLYIPLMSFGTYLVLAGFSLGLCGKFSPDALTLQFSKGLIGWLLQILLLKALIYSAGGGGEAALLDVVAYAGYAFAGAAIAVGARIFSRHAFYLVLPFAGLCGGVFLVKTMKRIVFSGGRSYDHGGRLNYLLLSLVAAQFPLLLWLGNVCR